MMDLKPDVYILWLVERPEKYLSQKHVHYFDVIIRTKSAKTKYEEVSRRRNVSRWFWYNYNYFDNAGKVGMCKLLL